MNQDSFKKFKPQHALIVSEQGTPQKLLQETLECDGFTVSATALFDGDMEQHFANQPQIIIWDTAFKHLEERNVIEKLKDLYSHLHVLYIVVDRHDHDTIRQLYAYGIHQLLYTPLAHYEIRHQLQLGLQNTFLHQENQALADKAPDKQTGHSAPQHSTEKGEELYQLRRSLHAAQRLFQTIFNGVNDAILLQNQEGIILDVNVQMLQLFGITEIEIYKQSFTKNLSRPENNWSKFQAYQDAAMAGETVCFEWIATRHDNQKSFDAEIFYRKIKLGSETMLLMSMRDISPRKRLERQLREEAATDELTGIYNRRMFAVLYHELLGVARRYSQPFSFSILDIDHLKQINDTHGHLFGDQVLIKVAEIVDQETRASDIFGRFGGDEFSLAFPNTRRTEAKVICKRIIQKLQSHEFTTPSGQTLFVTASIGISELNDPQLSEDALFEQADKALYAAKSHGRNRISIS